MSVHHRLHLYTDRHDGGGGNLPEDSATSVGGYTPHSPDTKEHTTLIPVTPANTESPGVTEVTVDGDSNVNVDGPLPGNVEKQHILSCYRGYFLCRL